MAQAVECLLNRWEALSSNCNMAKKRKEKKQTNYSFLSISAWDLF
jgi:hypothetical protein